MPDIDALTQLKNAEALHRDVKQWFLRPDWSCLEVNLDRFRRFIEYYGHVSGDVHLIATARMLEKAMPDAEIYRIGGDEFVCLIEKPLACATELARQIVAEARNLSIDLSHGKTGGCSVCVVVAHVPTHAANRNELNGLLFQAMKAAKFRGCSQIVVAQNENAR